MSNKDDGSPSNPMLYDPIPEGPGDTKKLMQFVASSIVCLGAVAAGTVLAWTAPVLPQLHLNDSSIKITDSEGTWIGSFLAIGALFGALPSGILAEKIGRKYTSMSLGIPFTISWLLIVFASNATMLCAGRFFAGIATGAACVVLPMFVSEIGETSVRGVLGSFFQLFLTIGILMVYVLGAYSSWVTTSIICAIVPVLLVVLMMIVPESPVYLLKKDRTNDAAAAIKWFWGPKSNTRSAIQTIKTDLDSSSGQASLKDLINNRANVTALIISLSLMMFQQLSGINAVIFYTNSIFKSAGSTMDENLCSIVVGVVQVLMTFVSAMLIDRAGRRMLLLQSCIVMGACLVTLGIYFNIKESGGNVTNIGWLPLLSVVLFIVSFSLGFGPIPWMMMGELFAPDVKGIASAIAVMFNWTLVFIVTKSFEPMQQTLGSDWTFWFFGAMMALCTVFVALKVPETKGKSNAEIQLILADKPRNTITQKYIPMGIDEIFRNL